MKLASWPISAVGTSHFARGRNKEDKQGKNNFDTIRKWKESLCAGIARKERATFEITRNDFGNDVARSKSARKVRDRGRTEADTNRVIQAERVKLGLMNVVGRILPIKKF